MSGCDVKDSGITHQNKIYAQGIGFPQTLLREEIYIFSVSGHGHSLGL